MERLTSALDVLGSAALVAGVAIIAGLGWALICGGVVLLGISWGLAGRPLPKRSGSDS